MDALNLTVGIRHCALDAAFLLLSPTLTWLVLRSAQRLKELLQADQNLARLFHAAVLCSVPGCDRYQVLVAPVFQMHKATKLGVLPFVALVLTIEDEFEALPEEAYSHSVAAASHSSTNV